MQKLASDFTKTNIITKKERVILGTLKEIIIDPDTGKVTGIMFHMPREKKPMVANTGSVVGFGMNFIMIEDMAAVSPPEEIIRIKEVLDKDIKVLTSNVFDTEKRQLGKVRDYSINLLEMKLARIYVRKKRVLRPFFKNFIISSENIVKIEKNKITVKSGAAKESHQLEIIVKGEKPTRAKIAHTSKQE